jgi:hypothetical protein
MLMGMIEPLTAISQDSAISPAQIINGVFLGETPPLRDLPALSEEDWTRLNEKFEQKARNPKLRTRSYPYADQALPKGPDEAWQKQMGDDREVRAPIQNYNGTDTQSFPSDANGTIGPNHYMQTINTLYTIYDRTNTIVAGPTAINTIFYGLNGAENNDGDPIVLYDEQADRWLVAEFSISGANDYMLIAVSTTNDPTGTWYKYSWDVSDAPDYEKFGIWQDGYYMGTNTGGAGKMDIYVFERSMMLMGQPAMGIGFDNPWRPTTMDGFMCVPPLDNDGPFAPAGEPGLFITLNDDAIGGGTDQLWIYELDVDWATPANSTFARTQQIPVTAFDSNFGLDWSNIKQPVSAIELDAIPMVIMNPPQYRNFGTYETIVCCHTVDVDNTDHAGIRWYELRRVSSGNWTIRQQGTYAPDGNSRWMGSVMLNGANEIALGYSISSLTIYPGIRYCAQSSTAYTAANSTMDVAESIIHTGDTCQYSLNRWGDYSAMQVDPTDDETFWFTTQYVDYEGTSFKRKTKIANFQVGTVLLTANFVANNVIPPLYSTVNFTDVSFGGPTAWNWTISPSSYYFINGTNLSSQNPQVQFTAPGNYTISLTVTNGGNNNTETKTNYINVQDCPNLYLPYTEDFSDGALPNGWKNIDNVGNGHVWLFNNPSGYVINTTTGGNGVAILDSYYYGVSYQQNADLISPLFDFTDYSTINLSFQQYFKIYGTYPPYSALGKLFYSVNNGITWNLVATWAGTNNANTYSVGLTAQVAGQSKVRFKWNYTGYGNFWAIDDLSITGTGPNLWTGTTSTNWTIGTNWSTGSAPTGTSNVIIPASAPNWPAITGDLTLGASCDKMTIYGNSQLNITGNVSIPAGKTLAFKGNGQISLTGNWNNLGNFLPGSGTVKFSGSGTSLLLPFTIPTSTITNYQRSTFAKGMTDLVNPLTGPTMDNKSEVYDIGFTFNYHGTDYTQVLICTNGWLSLGSGNSTSQDNSTLFTTAEANNVLAPWFDDLIDDNSSVVGYKLEGATPYRVFTAEWKSIHTYSNKPGAKINFQVKLFETSNIIEFHYGSLTGTGHSASESASIGIEDATGGPNHFIEATTGSTTTGVTTLVSTTQWPTVNYRFIPAIVTHNFANVTLDKSGATGNFNPNMVVKGNLSVTNGTLNGPPYSIETIQVGGNWTNNGTINLGSSSVIFNGLTNQAIGGTASTTFPNLTLNNSAGFTLQNNETVSGTLTMTAGSINCGSYMLQLGTSETATGTLAWTSGNISGSFKRWIAASTVTPLYFPVGTTTSNHLAKITFTNNNAGSLTSKFEPGDPGNNTGFPLTDGSETIEVDDLYMEGTWTLVATGLTIANYALELSATGFTSAGDPDATVRILKRPDAGGNWILNGTHVDGTPPVAKRSGLSGFSRFVLAKPGQLPKISGTLTYYNLANTPLNSGITVKLYKDGEQVGTDFSVTTGTYQFLNLQPGTYEIRASSSQPTTGSVNTSDAAQVNYWAVNPYSIEKVRFYSGDVTGADHYINSTDASRIQSNFVSGATFDRPTWMFWKTGETISSNNNPSDSYPTVTVASSNVTANIYGLCTGDFNRSFLPGVLRSSTGDLQLVYRNEILANPGEILELPLTITESHLVGSFSLIIIFPVELVEIRDVIMPENSGRLDWAVTGNELRIGWFSANPLFFSCKDELLVLKLLPTSHFTSEKVIKILLADNILNELADHRYNEIENASLSVDILIPGFEGLEGPDQAENMELSCYPNPGKDFTTISYSLPYPGNVTLEIRNVFGMKINLSRDEFQTTGNHNYKLTTSTLPPGFYIISLNLTNQNKQVNNSTRLLITK